MVKKFIAASLCVAFLLLAEVPRRIVSTAPSITEMLYALGLGDRVVGVTKYCHYPPDAQTKPKIGDYVNPSLETIASMRPDLVIIQQNPVQLARRLTALHLKTLEIDHESIERIYVAIRTIGDAAGVRPQADRLVAKLTAELATIRNATSKRPRTRMMFVIGRTPGSLEGLIVVGKSSYLNEIIDIAGGDNIFRDAIAAYPNVAQEQVLARNPEVIVDMGEMSETEGVTELQKQSVVKLWGRYPTLAAVRKHRVVAVASDIFVVPGPRVTEAARAFAAILQPEAHF